MGKASYFLAICGLIASSCSLRPVGKFKADATPPVPDYADTLAWAALPFLKDSADLVPDSLYRDMQEQADVDVFFLYPTTYTGKAGQRDWNGDVRDEKLNVITDRSSIRNQATIFNGSCKVYAPRYRQGHLNCFFTKKRKDDAEQALNLAYRDVYAAFEYYLEHYNQGRPLIIASHSQGTVHAGRLINEFYRAGNDMPPLVTAYLVGMPVEKDTFENFMPCAAPDDISCFCSWRTVDEKYRTKRRDKTGDVYAVINPLSWTNDVELMPRALHQGAVLRDFYDGLFPDLLEARIDDGLLRVTREKIPEVLFVPTRNYHVADYNFFYANIRLNVAKRIEAYFEKSPKAK